MFNYAKAYFRVWAFLESLALSHYWPVVKNLPSILATRSAGEADFQYETQLKALGGLQKSGFLRGTDVPGAPGRLAVWSEDEGSLEVEDALVCPSFSHGSHHDFKEPRTRGYKIQFKERNKPPDPNYSQGEAVWLYVDGEWSFKLLIASDGEWIESEKQWKYQVRQTDGKLYESGKLVGEDDLNRNKK